VKGDQTWGGGGKNISTDHWEKGKLRGAFFKGGRDERPTGSETYQGVSKSLLSKLINKVKKREKV